jgi:hypothetical protein
MADVHGNPNITSNRVGSVPTNPDRQSIERWVQVGPFWIPLGPSYVDALDVLADEEKKAE